MNNRAEEDRRTMREKGKIVLDLVRCRNDEDGDSYEIMNHDGSLKFTPTQVKTGKHNIAGIRRTAYFVFEGDQWSGANYGNNLETCYCKRIKRRVS